MWSENASVIGGGDHNNKTCKNEACTSERGLRTGKSDRGNAMVISKNPRQIAHGQHASPIEGEQWLNPNVHVRWESTSPMGAAIVKSKNTRQIVDGRSTHPTGRIRFPNDDL